MSAVLSQLKKWIRYKPTSRAGRFAFRITVAAAGLLAVGLVLRPLRDLVFVIDTFLAFVLAVVFLFLGLRVLNRKLLWKVRNRLIMTYLLMGLAPIVLFGTITAIASYVFAGQYATNAAITVLDETERRVQDESTAVAFYLNSHPKEPMGNFAFAGDYGASSSKVALAYLDGNTWRSLSVSMLGVKTPPSPFNGHLSPTWLQRQFDGTILLDGHLYLCSLAVIRNDTTTTTVMGSIPLERETLDPIAKGLGRIIVTPVRILTRGGDQNVDLPPNVAPASDQNVGEVASILRPEGAHHMRTRTSMKGEGAAKEGSASQAEVGKGTGPQSVTTRFNLSPNDFEGVYGGTVPPSDRIFDLKISFSAPLPIISWESGEIVPALVGVFSRPTVLYTRLFATSVTTGSVVRVGLIVISILFGLLELFSLLMAVQLSRTITGSVADIYEGTVAIDRGNLAHRIPVERKDQLGALSQSFNTMAESIQDLLVQQRENDRLLNELMIAQEVQKNLFPSSPIRAGNLEIHALSMPARTVSGDYYDYIFTDDEHLCIALGDISGKGISAALLMASLNSAVRAFTLGSGSGSSKEPSPADLLGCLNRHLYRSTTQEKYATLFLAFFDKTKNTITYSNGGHLAPLVISEDGEVRRLECGGPVVGLLDNLKYDQATVQLREGDLLVAFSDGLTEPERQDEEFGEDRLQAFVELHKGKELGTLALAAISEVKQWIGDAEQPDDMTILVARYV